MEKSKKKTIIIIVAVVIKLIIAVWLIWSYTPLIKGIIATNMYGTETCDANPRNRQTDEVHYPIPLAGLEIRICPICNRQEWVNGAEHPKMCTECGNLTGRCKQCGKLLKKDK